MRRLNQSFQIPRSSSSSSSTSSSRLYSGLSNTISKPRSSSSSSSRLYSCLSNTISKPRSSSSSSSRLYSCLSTTISSSPLNNNNKPRYPIIHHLSLPSTLNSLQFATQKRPLMTATILTFYHETLPLVESYTVPIMLMALSVRTLILPLVYLGARESAKLSMVLPEIQYLHSLYKNELNTLAINDTAGRWAKTKAFGIGARKLMRLRKTSVSLIVAPVVIQIPIIFTVAYQMRQIMDTAPSPEKIEAVRNGITPDVTDLSTLNDSLTNSGSLWFTDLTLADPTYILPILFTCVVYGNMELSLGIGNPAASSQSNIVQTLKSGLQQFMIVCTPFISVLPAGIQVYMVTSTTLSALQIYTMRLDSVREALGLPLLGTKFKAVLPAMFAKEQAEIELKNSENRNFVTANESNGGEQKKENVILRGFKPGTGVLLPGTHNITSGELRTSTIDIKNITNPKSFKQEQLQYTSQEQLDDSMISSNIMESANRGDAVPGFIGSEKVVFFKDIAGREAGKESKGKVKGAMVVKDRAMKKKGSKKR